MCDLGPLASTLAPIAELQEQAFEAIRRWLCDAGRCRATPPGGLTPTAFGSALAGAQADVRGLVPRFIDRLREILEWRQALLVLPDPYAGLERDVAALVAPDFLRTTPYAQLAHFPRYLKAMQLRAERARKHPAKDTERAAQLAPYEKALRGFGVGAGLSRDESGRKAPPTAGHLRWLVEEFRVSLFAQELGTAKPVSAKKLDRVLAELSADTPALAARPAPAPKPIVTAPVMQKKSAALKELGALDRLFPR
jgi:ATP-dependent helicase HrpA